MRRIGGWWLLGLAVAGCSGVAFAGCAGDATWLEFEGPGADEAVTGAELPVPLPDCAFMTVLIDYSRNGDSALAARVAGAMEDEFESLGAEVTDVGGQAYWSLMILAADNARRDGYIFSALLSSRNMSEGQGPGVTRFDAEKRESRDGNARPETRERIPTLYNGLSYGPYDKIEDQARAYVRQAYAAIYPAAKQLCDFEVADQARERELDAQVPGPPEPL